MKRRLLQSLCVALAAVLSTSPTALAAGPKAAGNNPNVGTVETSCGDFVVIEHRVFGNPVGTHFGETSGAANVQMGVNGFTWGVGKPGSPQQGNTTACTGPDATVTLFTPPGQG